MLNLNNLLSPTIFKLVKALDVNIKSYEESQNKGLYPIVGELFYNPWNGFYSSDYDTIFINEMGIVDNMNEVIMHELIHWSGAKERLGRLFFYQEDQYNVHKYHTEEAVAQIGMLKLALVLGLNPAKYEQATLEYLKKYTKLDLKEADKESDKAVDYLVSFIGLEKVA